MRVRSAARVRARASRLLHRWLGCTGGQKFFSDENWEARSEALRVRAPCEVNEADCRLRLNRDYSHYRRAKSIHSRGGGARGFKFLLE